MIKFTRFSWFWMVVIFLSPLAVYAEEPAPESNPPPAVETASETPAPDEIEILGPHSVEIGRLAVFTLPESVKDASWTIIPPVDCVVDSNQKSLVTTSDIAYTYHIVVAIIGSDSRPKILVHECSFTEKGEPNPSPNPHPTPNPEPKNITEWIEQNLPADKKEDGKKLGNVYSDVVSMIDRGTVQSLDAIYSQVRNGTLKAVNVIELKPFLDGLESQIQKANATDSKALREIFQEVAKALEGEK